jgi:hypothetical protein
MWNEMVGQGLETYRGGDGELDVSYWDSTYAMAKNSPSAATAVILLLMHRASGYRL